MNRDLQLPSKPKLDAPGLFFVRAGGRTPKMTTAATMLLGQHATQNRIELTSEQAKAYLQRQTVALNDAQAAASTSTGYIILGYRSYPLGLGLFRADTNEVESLFPKAWSRPDVQL